MSDIYLSYTLEHRYIGEGLVVKQFEQIFNVDERKLNTLIAFIKRHNKAQEIPKLEPGLCFEVTQQIEGAPFLEGDFKRFIPVHTFSWHLLDTREHNRILQANVDYLLKTFQIF